MHLLHFLLNKCIDKPKLMTIFNFKHLLFNYFLGLVSYNDRFVPNHCRRRGLLLRVVTPNDTHTHTHTNTHTHKHQHIHTHSVGLLLWTRDRSATVFYLTTHAIYRRQKSIPPARLESAISAESCRRPTP